MARKRSKSAQRSSGAPTLAKLPAGFVAGMQEVEDLLARKRWIAARVKLEELDRRYPNRHDVLSYLVNVNYELRDTRGYQSACENLLRVDPNHPEALLGLAGAYMSNVRPALAIRQFQRFLERYPDHEQAPRVRQDLAGLEETMQPVLEQHGFTGPDGLELAQMHEEVQVLLESGNYLQSRYVAERLLQRKPDFVSGWNNLSQVYSFEGNLERAIAIARHVLELDAQNFHALSNLSRFLLLNGQIDAARDVAEQLKQVESNDPIVWSKQAEVLAFLGDDEGVLEAFRSAERSGVLAQPFVDPLLYHLTAVATLRQGNEREARRLWQQALKINPGFTFAQENLDDLEKPIGEREAPWPYPMNYWMTVKTRDDLMRLLGPVSKGKKEGAVTSATRRFLQAHPEIVPLVPLLLDRGDFGGRGFALRLGMVVETPELLSALCDFALSQRGPDQTRIEAAQAAMKGGALPAGPQRMWIKGEWREILLLGFEVVNEQMTRHPPQVEKLLEQAVNALHERDGVRAEEFLVQARELEPDAPGILNNLAMSYELQGRNDEANTLMHDVFERFPDYFFGRIGMGRLAIRQRDFDQARAMLDPLLQRTRLHFTEATALFNAQVELAEARKEYESAHHWLDMWASIDPENPAINLWRLRLDPSALLGGLLKRRGRK